MSSNRAICDWCKANSAPLRLTNMLVNSQDEVEIVCSSCVLKAPNRRDFGDSVPWPKRFYGEREFLMENWQHLAVLAMIVAWVVLALTFSYNVWR